MLRTILHVTSKYITQNQLCKVNRGQSMLEMLLLCCRNLNNFQIWKILNSLWSKFDSKLHIVMVYLVFHIPWKCLPQNWKVQLVQIMEEYWLLFGTIVHDYGFNSYRIVQLHKRSFRKKKTHLILFKFVFFFQFWNMSCVICKYTLYLQICV